MQNYSPLASKLREEKEVTEGHARIICKKFIAITLGNYKIHRACTQGLKYLSRSLMEGMLFSTC